MIIKLLGAIFIISVLCVVWSGINTEPIYQKSTQLRDKSLPTFDKIIEKGLQDLANAKIKEKIQPLINNLTRSSA